MGSFRKNALPSQHGIALITVLIIAFSGVALVGGIFYLLRGSLKIVTLNREFKNVQEAAGGAIEYGVALIKYLIQHEGDLPSAIRNDLGIGNTVNLSPLYQCNPAQQTTISLKTPGDQYGLRSYRIRLTITCQNYHLIPGSESLRFPPPPTGTGGNKSYYVLYYINAVVKGGDTVADVESVYRTSM
ncbi:MAG: hypothetical protein N2260_06875 [Syntrophobacterales bacterium]|nr:hypothetical protein [Syntrophobacterales bacterium]